MKNTKKPQGPNNFFREMERRGAVSEAEETRKARLKKSEKLRELRLAKEAEDRVAQAATPVKSTGTAKKKAHTVVPAKS